MFHSIWSPRRLESIVKVLLAPVVLSRIITMASTAGNCPNCRKLLSYIADIESHYAVLVASSESISKILKDLKNSSDHCSTTETPVILRRRRNGTSPEQVSKKRSKTFNNKEL